MFLQLQRIGIHLGDMLLQPFESSAVGLPCYRGGEQQFHGSEVLALIAQILYCQCSHFLCDGGARKTNYEIGLCGEVMTECGTMRQLQERIFVRSSLIKHAALFCSIECVNAML
ncbi:hypothetical protein L1987_81864 [Smallanthus sonchifolius]|uniref:Uncharacterized protein n=1 Tax=Smallanthus sonchifolius TaxID=185202 RepID=A0ACB8YSV7_9ASTR|nr:hypothetical protein L1987_81864 [Smallanthus sonchifolius]